MELAERPPYVRFETRAEEDRNASIEAGHYVAQNVDYALITPPGSKDCVEKIALEWLDQIKQKALEGSFPQTWSAHFAAVYKAWKEENAMPENGAPIKGWQIISPAQQAQILAANIRTVEDLACANEEALRRIGMGSRDLKNKAEAWIETANGIGKVASENAALKAENADMQDRIAQLEQRLAALEPRKKHG